MSPNYLSHLLLLLLLLALTALTLLLSSSDAAGPALLDFCVPDPGPTNPIKLTHLHTYPCKDPSTLTVDDFIYSGIRNPSPTRFPTGFLGTSVTSAIFPALHTLGISFARADIEPGGFNGPIYKTRASEVLLVVRGRVYAGFVDSGGRLFAKVVEEGDAIIFPRGMVHFVMNVGKNETATVVAFYNEESRGGVNIPKAVFGSGIREELLEKAFELSEEEVERLKNKFGSSGLSGTVAHVCSSLDTTS